MQAKIKFSVDGQLEVSVPFRGIGSEKPEVFIDESSSTLFRAVSVPFRGIGSEKRFYSHCE